MSDVIGVLLPVFLLIASGIVMRRTQFLPDTFWTGLDKLNYFVLFPALLFQNLADAHLERLPAANILAVVWIALGTVSVTLLVSRKLVSSDGASFTSVFQGSIRFSSYVALGTIPALFGQDAGALTAILVAITVPSVNVLAVLVLSAFGARTIRPLIVARSIISNPLILACLAGWIVNQTRLEPAFVASTLKSLGSASLPCGLISVGAGLSFAGISGQAVPMLTSMLGKFLLLPAATLLACALLRVPDDLSGVLVFFHALPTAPASYVLARQLGGDHRLMAAIITVQTLAAFLVMPLVFFLVSR